MTIPSQAAGINHNRVEPSTPSNHHDLWLSLTNLEKPALQGVKSLPQDGMVNHPSIYIVFFLGGDFEVSQILGPSLVSSCLNRITYSLMSDVFFSHQLWVNPYLAYLGMFAELFNLVILDYHVLSLQFFFLGSGTWRCPTSLLTRITCTTCRKCRGATKKG